MGIQYCSLRQHSCILNRKTLFFRIIFHHSQWYVCRGPDRVSIRSRPWIFGGSKSGVWTVWSGPRKIVLDNTLPIPRILRGNTKGSCNIAKMSTKDVFFHLLTFLFDHLFNAFATLPHPSKYKPTTQQTQYVNNCPTLNL